MKKTIALLMTAVMLLVMFAGCGSKPSVTPGGDTPAGEKKVKDTLTLVTDIEPDTMDPRRGNTVANNTVMALIYDSLVGQDTDDNFIPRLATSWELIDDTHMRFHLRDDVKFSNGYDFTASDVLFSFARTKLDSTSMSTMAWYDEESSYAEDDHTVVLAMHYPYAPALSVLSGGRTWIGSEKAITEMGEEAHARAPIGSGPYVLKNWTTGASLELSVNENYWGEAPKTPNIMYKIIPEATGRVIALETGEADFAYYIDGPDVERVNALSGYHVEKGPSLKYYTIVFNMQNPKFADERVRYALSHAIDLEALVDAGFDGTANVMRSVIPQKAEGWKDIYGTWDYNPEKAKDLLKEAGAENLSFELHTQPTTEFQKLAEIVQAFWQDVGVTVNIEQSALATREAQGPWEASMRHGNAAEITGILIIYDSKFASRVGNNDDKLDNMLYTLQATYDLDERAQQISDLQDYIYNMRFTIPFAETDSIYGISDKIENFEFTYGISRLNVYDWVIYE